MQCNELPLQTEADEGSSLQCLTLKLTLLGVIETSLSICKSKRLYIPKYFNPPQQRSENLKFRKMETQFV
jgi:hypothetical protein